MYPHIKHEPNLRHVEQQVRERKLLKSMEDEESKRIAVDINIMERTAALDHCALLGFTPANTPGVDQVKPRVVGIKDAEVDFDAMDGGESQGDINSKRNQRRVVLGDIAQETEVNFRATGHRDAKKSEGGEDYIKFDVDEERAIETPDYNHRLRRKLRRAIDKAEIQKEVLVRQRALEYYDKKGMEIPSELRTPYKTINIKGQRTLEDGTLESSKQERVRARLELAEFNSQMRILRKQAKDAALYAGLRKHAELMGKISCAAPLKVISNNVDVLQANGTDVLDGRESSSTLASPGFATIAYADSKEGQDSDDSSLSGDSYQPEITMNSSCSTNSLSSRTSKLANEDGPRERHSNEKGRYLGRDAVLILGQSSMDG